MGVHAAQEQRLGTKTGDRPGCPRGAKAAPWDKNRGQTRVSTRRKSSALGQKNRGQTRVSTRRKSSALGQKNRGQTRVSTRRKSSALDSPGQSPAQRETEDYGAVFCWSGFRTEQGRDGDCGAGAGGDDGGVGCGDVRLQERGESTGAVPGTGAAGDTVYGGGGAGGPNHRPEAGRAG